MAARETSLFDAVSALIGQSVRVQLQDGSAADGVLYCIDPETDHVALLCPSGDDSSYSVKIAMAHHVVSVEKGPLERADIPTLVALQLELSDQENGRDSHDDQASIERRREKLGEFLAKHFVPFDVAEDGGIRVFGGAALVPPPFRAVQCSNEQLLRRLQQLLTQFRQQEEP